MVRGVVGVPGVPGVQGVLGPPGVLGILAVLFGGFFYGGVGALVVLGGFRGSWAACRLSLEDPVL